MVIVGINFFKGNRTSSLRSRLAIYIRNAHFASLNLNGSKMSFEQ